MANLERPAPGTTSRTALIGSLTKNAREDIASRCAHTRATASATCA